MTDVNGVELILDAFVITRFARSYPWNLVGTVVELPYYNIEFDYITVKIYDNVKNDLVIYRKSKNIRVITSEEAYLKILEV